MTEDNLQNKQEANPVENKANENTPVQPDPEQNQDVPEAKKKKKSFFSRGSRDENAKQETKPVNPENAEDEESAKNDGTSTDCPDKTTELEQKLAEANDKFLRLFSDFDNFRKRTAREKIEMAKTASLDLILQLIPVVDDFERALKSMDASDESTLPIRQGIELIYNKFWSILERQGVKPIEAIGHDFDTDFHEALTNIPVTDESMKGKVIDQVEKGYLLGEKVIRFAKVVVGA